MKTIIKYLSILALLFAVSCQDDNYQLKETKPRGGFIERSVEATAGYLEESITAVECNLELQNMNTGQSVELGLNLVSVEPDSLSSAISLATENVTVTGRDSVALDLANVDWSKLEPGATITATFGIKDASNINTNTQMQYISVIANKLAPPVLSLDNGNSVHEAYLDADATENRTIELSFNILSIPAEQDLLIPVRLNEYLAQEGVHFNMPSKALRINKGETSGTISIEIINNAFTNLRGEFVKLWIEVYQDDVSAEQLVTIDPDFYWTEIKVGRSLGDNPIKVVLDPDATFTAMISNNAPYDTVGTITLELLNICDAIVQSDVNIPVTTFSQLLTEGTHYSFDDANISIASGTNTGYIDINVHGVGFNADENGTINLQVDKQQLPNGFVTEDPMWWTNVNVGRTNTDPAILLTLFTGNEYYAYISNDATGEQTITLTFDNFASQPVASETLIPININPNTYTEGTHFRFDNKNIKIEAGSTSGTIDVVVLPDGWDTDENGNIWIEIAYDDLPGGFIADETNWWTWLYLGKQ